MLVADAVYVLVYMLICHHRNRALCFSSAFSSSCDQTQALAGQPSSFRRLLLPWCTLPYFSTGRPERQPIRAWVVWGTGGERDTCGKNIWTVWEMKHRQIDRPTDRFIDGYFSVFFVCWRLNRHMLRRLHSNLLLQCHTLFLILKH